MSTSRTVSIWCDGIDGQGCTEWTHAGEESHKGVTDTKARELASYRGWSRVKGFDLCPECTIDYQAMKG